MIALLIKMLGLYGYAALAIKGMYIVVDRIIRNR
jgi:hypothetical protein